MWSTFVSMGLILKCRVLIFLRPHGMVQQNGPVSALLLSQIFKLWFHSGVCRHTERRKLNPHPHSSLLSIHHSLYCPTSIYSSNSAVILHQSVSSEHDEHEASMGSIAGLSLGVGTHISLMFNWFLTFFHFNMGWGNLFGASVKGNNGIFLIIGWKYQGILLLEILGTLLMVDSLPVTTMCGLCRL